MKSSQTMQQRAELLAKSKGLRRFGKKVGFGLGIQEMKELFFREKFNPNRKTMPRYLAMWSEYGLMHSDMENGAYWFPMTEFEQQMVRKKASEMGIPEEDLVIF